MTARRWLRIANIALTLAVGVVWFQLYRPQLVGGPASYAVVEGSSMDGTLDDGDLVVTRGHDAYHVGEIITFRAPGGLPVIHRIVAGDASTGYVTKGDNRRTPDPWRVMPAQVIGSVAARMPFVGTVVSVLREPPLMAWMVGSIVLTALWGLERRLGRRRVPLLSSMVRPDHPDSAVARAEGH